MLSQNGTLQLTVMIYCYHFSGIFMNGGPLIIALKNFDGYVNPSMVTTERRGLTRLKDIFKLHFHYRTTDYTIYVFQK